MARLRFSVFEAILNGFKMVLDNIRIFILAAFVQIAVFLGYFLLFSYFAVAFFKDLWKLYPQFLQWRTMLPPDTVLFFTNVLWPSISSLMMKYLLVAIIFFAGMYFIGIAIYLGLLRIVLVLHDTGKSSVRLLFSCFGLAPKAFIAGLICFAMVSIGMIAFIIPGIYLLLRLIFFPFFIVDKDTGVINSLQKSWVVTEGQGWPLFGLLMVTVFVPLLAGTFGMLVMAPVFTASMVYAYRKLVK